MYPVMYPVMHRSVVLLTGLPLVGLLLAGCTGGASEPPDTAAPSVMPSAAPSGVSTAPPAAPATTPSAVPTASGSTGPITPGPSGTATVEVSGSVVEGLEVPWGLAFLPGGDALVSGRDNTRIQRVTPDGQLTDVGEIPGVAPGGEGGLLGLAVSPDFADNRYVYAYFTSDQQDNRIVRMTYDEGDNGLSEPEVLVDGIPAGGIHNGGRLAFGPDGMLYAGTGESGDTGLSQDRGSLGGKILRLQPDGGVPADNPFDGSLVWSYGHRNVQGLAFDGEGRLWASEFGQTEFDELNRIEKGGNYGWPECEGRCETEGLIDPQVVWSTAEASPSGIAIAGDAVYMAGLRGERLWQIPIDGSQAGRPRDHLTGEYGRLRTVVLAPDGTLWLTTSNTDGRGDPRDGDDRILRLTLG